jgi:hypothetical protein
MVFWSIVLLLGLLCASMSWRAARQHSDDVRS